MKRKGPKVGASLLLLSWFGFRAVFAACEDTEKDRVSTFGYSGALSGQATCWGSDKDSNSPLAESIGKLPNDEGDVVKRAKLIAEILGQMRAQADVQLAAAPSDAERQIWLAVKEALNHEKQTLEQPFESFPEGELRIWKQTVLSPQHWEFASDRIGVVGGINVMQFDFANCQQSPPEPDQCAAYQSRKNLLRIANSARRLASYIVADESVADLKRLQLRDTQWTEYHEGALFQWPWELVFNGYRMKSSKSKWCDRDASGMQQGFCRVPNETYILLHPDTGVMWVDGAESSSEMHGTAYLEIFGRYSWKWDAEGKITKPRGWSAIAVYTDLFGESEVGYGLMYHGSRGNQIAITVTDGQVGILASVALADRLLTASKNARAKLKSIQGQMEAALGGATPP